MAPRIFTIIVAAGSGQRCPGQQRKQLTPLLGKPLFLWCLETFHRIDQITDIILVGPADSDDLLQKMGSIVKPFTKVRQVVPGGNNRQKSVLAGLTAIHPTAQPEDLILIHDGVRPLVSTQLITQVIDRSAPGTVIAPVITPAETVKSLGEGTTVIGTLPRNRIGLAQTPQGAPFALLWSSYQSLKKTLSPTITDDAHLVELACPGTPIDWIEGEQRNVKITYPEDLALAEYYLRGSVKEYSMVQTRVTTGLGYDVHRLVTGRPLILGGVSIPHQRGLEGHSDADVVIHALVDAVLGAVAGGDIGQHFPDSDQRHRDADSRYFLQYAVKLATDKQFTLQAVDVTIVAQQPKLAPYLPQMYQRIGEILGPTCQVNIKATTTEGLGFTGSGEGIAAYAVATAHRLGLP
ncbi:MAG: 2-C-methyl-D-erythritol 2,4-cyclodiphosphate synthase [Deltaproteobacteria bacterium]|nr:2-C-methyl-D-erythritol 2,4-cyclodiphosphate synthase [Candidatus Anaeroferrophillus wilburensis]MBN2888092.1 2-C-methyl-D-erythritol 2,4-cyclodiphosphate synthase [Deltaproteobacteria bacterium]